jgi:hypothetical protein
MFSLSSDTRLTCLPPIFDPNSMHIETYSLLFNELKSLKILVTLLHVQQYYRVHSLPTRLDQGWALLESRVHETWGLKHP